jgi:outer membrane protein assembly factor BamB
VRGSSTEEFSTVRTKEAVPESARVAWPTYGYDPARTHVGPPSIRLRPPFRRLWMVRTGFYIEFPPAMAYGKVFVSQLHGRFYAVDGPTGQFAWRKWFRGYCSAASPAVWNGVVYETYMPPPCDRGDRHRRGFVAAMRAKTGRVLWRWYGGASESSPLILGGILYIGSWNHRVYALDVRGVRPKVRWSVLTDAEIDSSAAFANGTIYIGTNGGRLYAITAATGRIRWRSSSFSGFLRSREYFYATPTVAYGRVFVGNTDGTVYAYGATTGRLIWARPAGTYVYTAAAVWNRTVYVGSYDGNVYALDAATGDVRWKTDLGGSIHGAPTILDGLVYFSTCGTCGQHGSRFAKRGPRRTFALDARTGRIVWRFPDGHYSPVVADAKHLYLVGDTRFYGLASKRP